jgi:hypothetical protein
VDGESFYHPDPLLVVGIGLNADSDLDFSSLCLCRLFCRPALPFLVALLVPQHLSEQADLKEYFYEHRAWFFGTMALVQLVDFGDTLVKGWNYFVSLGGWKKRAECSLEANITECGLNLTTGTSRKARAFLDQGAPRRISRTRQRTSLISLESITEAARAVRCMRLVLRTVRRVSSPT